jgi:hypothetical protein
LEAYISEFHILPGLEDDRLCHQALDATLSILSDYNVHAIRSIDFSSDYTTIKNQIDRSSLFIAFVDHWWTSSTWKAQELSYSLESAIDPGKNILVFSNGIDQEDLLIKSDKNIHFTQNLESFKRILNRLVKC